MGKGNYKHGFKPISQEGASSHFHGYPNELNGPKRKYDDSRRSKMGNHGGGIPKGSGHHDFHAGDHVHVRAGVHTGLEGKIRRAIGANHVHIVPKTGRSVIAHVKNVAHGSVGVRTKHLHARVG